MKCRTKIWPLDFDSLAMNVFTLGECVLEKEKKKKRNVFRIHVEKLVKQTDKMGRKSRVLPKKPRQEFFQLCRMLPTGQIQ